MREVWRALRDLVPLLPGRARLFLWLYMAATGILSLFDVVAMSLLALTISAVAAGDPVEIPMVGSFDTEATPWLLLVACSTIIVKSILAVVMHAIATRQFALYEYQIGFRLLKAYLATSWEERAKRNTAEFTRVVDTGVSISISGMVLATLTIPGNLLTILLTVTVLVIAQPLTAAIAIAYLGLVAAILNRAVTRKTLAAGRIDVKNTYRIATLLTEMVDSLKELTLRDRLDEVQEVVGRHRKEAVRARATKSFYMSIPRYAYEAALIGGFLLVGGFAYIVGDMTSAIVSVALFAAAGMRLIPALTGIQNSMISATASVPWVKSVTEDLRNAEGNTEQTSVAEDTQRLPEEPKRLHFTDVRFTYPTGRDEVLRGVSLDLALGSTLGLVGPSGSGKSTLVDLLLGLRSPSEGQISVDGIPLRDVIHQWRSRIGYVPQRVTLFDGTIGQNIALTWDDDYDRDKVMEVIEKAQLTSLLETRERGIDERIGERGMTLSGGQQQRLGIARALYSDPLVLVLDEATSALDTKTEDDVVRALKNLQGEVTIVAVAHRISTIKDYDQICYVDGGRILGTGTFQELAAAVPQFGLQVALAGLGDPTSGSAS